MADPDQKLYCLSKLITKLKSFARSSKMKLDLTDMEVKTLSGKLARVCEKDIYDDHDIDWEV